MLNGGGVKLQTVTESAELAVAVHGGEQLVPAGHGVRQVTALDRHALLSISPPTWLTTTLTVRFWVPPGGMLTALRSQSHWPLVVGVTVPALGVGPALTVK